MSAQGAGPYLPAEPSPLLPLSPIELFRQLLLRDLNPTLVPGGVHAGGADHPSQQLGCVTLMPAGNTQFNPHMPLQFARLQVRCLAHTLAHSEQIAQHVKDLFEVRHRELVLQPGSDNTFLIHRILLAAGPTGHYDSAATWEHLLFFELTIGTQPVS